MPVKELGMKKGAYVFHKSKPEWGIGLVKSIGLVQGIHCMDIEFQKAGKKRFLVEIASKRLKEIDYDFGVHEFFKYKLLPVTKSYVGVTVASNRKVRRTYCNSCKKALSNQVDLECKSCGWILCECGNCGCNSEKEN